MHSMNRVAPPGSTGGAWTSRSRIQKSWNFTIFAESCDLDNLDNQRRFGDSRGLSLGSWMFRPKKYVFTQTQQVLTKTTFLWVYSVSMNRIAPLESAGGTWTTRSRILKSWKFVISWSEEFWIFLFSITELGIFKDLSSGPWRFRLGKNIFAQNHQVLTKTKFL